MKQRKTIDFDEEDISWFESVYGPKSLTWAMNLMLKEFRAAHVVKPEDYAAIGARILKQKVDSII